MRKILLRGMDHSRDAMNLVRDHVERPVKGWLRAVREGLGLSQREVAERLKMSQQPYSNIEKREAEGTVTLETLRRGADALGCELVYFFVPKGKQSFVELARENDPDFKLMQASKHSMRLEGQSVNEDEEPNRKTQRS